MNIAFAGCCALALKDNVGLIDKLPDGVYRREVGKWTIELDGKTLLVLGFGRIGRRVAELAKAATTVDDAWKQYRSQCYQAAIRGTYDREWFALLTPGGLPADAGAGCVAYFGSMSSQIKQFRDLMRDVLTDARHANVLPGTIRDVLRTSRLDFEWQ